MKAHITDLMLSAPPRVRAQLSEALSIISSHDFPARWQTLLPHLVDKMASPDQQLVNGVLSTADSIYQRYRHAHQCWLPGFICIGVSALGVCRYWRCAGVAALHPGTSLAGMACEQLLLINLPRSPAPAVPAVQGAVHD